MLNSAWKRTSADGLADQAVRRLGVHGGVDAAAGDLDQDQRQRRRPTSRWVSASTHEEPGPGEEGDPQQAAGADPVGQVRHDRARRAGHRDGDRQQHAQLGVVESEKVCWMLNSITAQLPQKRPKVTKAATTGPAPGRAGRRRRSAGGRGRAQDAPVAPALARKVARSTHDPGHPARPDEAAAVALEPGGRDGEGEPATLDLDQGRLGQHDRARRPPGARWSNCTRVATLDCASVRCPSVARQRGLLAQGDEPGRGQHGHVARAEVLGGVLGADASAPAGRSARRAARARPRSRSCGWVGRHDDYDTAVTDTALIDPDVLERVLVRRAWSGAATWPRCSPRTP